MVESFKSEIPQNLEREFSNENITAYAEAARQIAWKLTEFVSDNQGESVAVIIPSRGPVPFFIAAASALRIDNDLREFAVGRYIETPPLACFRKIEDLNNAGEAEIADRMVRTLVFPLSAEFREGSKEETAETGKIVEDMRRFGARIVAEFFKPPEERKSPEFLFYLSFLKEVEGRENLIDFYRNFPQIKRAMFMDTVISGRASWTILDELAKIGLKVGWDNQADQVIPLLIVDKNGEALNKRYRQYVDQFPQGVVRVPRILTEDRGAALTGLVAVLYPNLILSAFKHPVCRGIYPYCGAWHNVPIAESQVYEEVFNDFLELLFKKIRGDEADFEEARSQFLHKLHTGRFLVTGDLNIKTITEFVKTGMTVERARETSSHIVEIDLPEKVAEEKLNTICSRMKQAND